MPARHRIPRRRERKEHVGNPCSPWWSNVHAPSCASVVDQPEAGDTEITLKSLQAAHDGLAQRTEISESVGNAPLEEILARQDGIGERIRQLVGQRPLTALFRAHTRRERQQLLEADSELALAEVDLDETSIEAQSGQSQELRRVEVECINAEPGALNDVSNHRAID